MRTWPALLLLLGACRPPSSADYVRDLLAKTPIPLKELAEVLKIRQGDLQVLGASPPQVLDYPAPPLWTLRNVSDRDLWIHRSELAIGLDVKNPLFALVLGCGGPMISRPLERPAFRDVDWIRLAPAACIPLLVPHSQFWGEATLSVHIGGKGNAMAVESERFNEAQDPAGESSWYDPSTSFSHTLGKSWILPPFDWAGLQPGSEQVGFPLDLTPSGEGRISWNGDIHTGEERSEPLKLLAFSLDEARRLTYQGPLDVLSHSASRRDPRGPLQVTTDYRLPSHGVRVMFLAPDFGAYATPQRQRSAPGFPGFTLWHPRTSPR